MRTTLDLDDTLIAELMKATKAKTKTDAIHLVEGERPPPWHPRFNRGCVGPRIRLSSL
jgi:hypothetical protein